MLFAALSEGAPLTYSQEGNEDSGKENGIRRIYVHCERNATKKKHPPYVRLCSSGSLQVTSAHWSDILFHSLRAVFSDPQLDLIHLVF